MKTEYDVDTVIPVRKNMDILQDVRGLVTLDADWQEYRPARRAPLARSKTKHPTAAKREKKRQKTLAKKRAAAQRLEPPDPSKVVERTLLTKVPELRTWSDCPVPLTGVYSKDCYADGHEQDWLLVTTNPHRSAAQEQYFAFFTLLEHTELMLSLEGKARRKALAKARRLQQQDVPS